MGTSPESGRREYDETVKYPRVRFQTVDGTEVEFEERGEIGFRPARFRDKAGDEVAVLYDPKDPHKARRDAFPALWSEPMLYMVWGVVLVYFGPRMFLDHLW